MDSHTPCVCRLIFIKMLKHLLILGLFLPTLFCRFIFQDSNNSNGNTRSSILENNFLDVERELSMASEIAGILENRRLSRVRVSLLWYLKSLTCSSSSLLDSSECGQRRIRTQEWAGNTKYHEPSGHLEGETPETNRQEQIKEAGKKDAQYNYV